MIRRPATILALLTALNLLNYLDRLVVAAVLRPLSRELGLSNFVAGSLATVFLLGYFLTSPIFGALADRGPRKGLIALGVAIWSAATFASGLAIGALTLIVARVIVGVGEASYATLAPTIIDDAAPAAKKGRWLAIFYVATPIGGALGYLVGGFILSRWGWRHAFYVAGGPGMLMAILCLFIQEPVRKKLAEKASIFAAVTRLWALRLYRRGVFGFCAYTFAIGGFSFWAPTFLQDRYGLSEGDANFRFGLLTVVGGALGTVIGGTWSDRWVRAKGVENDDAAIARINMRICAIGSMVGAPLTALAFLAPSSTLFFVIVFFCEVALFLCTSPINAVILRSVPAEARASAMALSIFGIHILGDLWSPPLVGALADHMPIERAMMLVPIAIAVSATIWFARAPTRAVA